MKRWMWASPQKNPNNSKTSILSPKSKQIILMENHLLRNKILTILLLVAKAQRVRRANSSPFVESVLWKTTNWITHYLPLANVVAQCVTFIMAA